MNIKKTAAGAAGVLIALYAGSGLFTGATQTVEAKGPVEIEVDQDGRLSTRPLSGAGHPGGEPSRTGAQVTNATQVAKTTTSGADQQDPEAATGAYWSDDAKTMLFVVSGEIFDAVSGDPIPDFGISAVGTYGTPAPYSRALLGVAPFSPASLSAAVTAANSGPARPLPPFATPGASMNNE